MTTKGYQLTIPVDHSRKRAKPQPREVASSLVEDDPVTSQEIQSRGVQLGLGAKSSEISLKTSDSLLSTENPLIAFRAKRSQGSIEPALHCGSIPSLILRQSAIETVAT